MAGNSSAIEAGRAFVKLYLRDDMAKALAKSLNKAGKSLKDFGSGTMKGGAGVMAGGAAILAPIAAGVAAYAEMGGAAVDASARTGLSVEALSELGFAAEQTGASMEDVEKAIKNIAKSGLAKAGESSEQAFNRLAGKIAATEDPLKRAALAQKAFGKAGMSLLPMLGDMEALRTKARELGIVMSTEDASAADDFGDALDALKAQSKAAFFQIGAAVAGPLVKFAKGAQKLAGDVIAWVKANKEIVATIAAVGVALTIAGAAITAIGAVIWGAGAALTALGAIVGVVLSPLGLLTAAIVGGTTAWFLYSDAGKAAWQSLISTIGPIVETLKATFSGVVTALKNGNWAAAGEIAMVGLQLALLEGMDAIEALFGSSIAAIGKQLAMGDLSGAMKTAAAELYSIWAAWEQMVVNLFTGIGRKLADAWESAVSALSRKILETSASGGRMGKAASMVLGVDMQAEQARADKLNAQAAKMGLATGPANVTEEAARNAAAAVKAKADAFRGILDGLDQAAQATLDEAAGDAVANVDGAASKAADKIAELRKRLESLSNAEEYQAAMAALQPTAGKPAGIAAAAAGASIAMGPTFSAAAAQAAGQFGAGNPQQQIAKAAEKQVGLMADVKAALAAGNELAQQAAQTWANFVSAMTYG